MTPQQIVGMGVRLFAVLIALSSIGYLGAVPQNLASSDFSEKAFYSYFVGGGYLIAAALLWFFPMSVANRIVPRTRYENRIDLQALEAARVGCSLIGLWFFARSLPGIVWFLFTLLMHSGQEPAYRNLNGDAKLDLLVTLAQLCFALVLIFRSGDFAVLVIRGKKPPAVE